MNILTKEDLSKYSDFLSVGQLRKFLADPQIQDDALVMIERVEDVYYEKNGWGVYLIPNDLQPEYNG